MPALNNDMVSLTLEAFEVFEHQLRVTALAIVGVEGDCLIATYYKQLHAPPYPTRFFATVSEGRQALGGVEAAPLTGPGRAGDRGCGDAGTSRTSHAGPMTPTVGSVSNHHDIRDFLTSRRARITPQQAGLTAFGTNRRVPGLRREEVAMLAGVSVDYYVRLERGNLTGVSDGVLEALCSALQLDDTERQHLYHFARSGTTEVRTRRRPGSRRVRPSVQRLLDSMVGAPAVVQNGRLDILAANDLGRALYAPLDEGGRGTVNYARATFLNPRSRDFYRDWERAANDSVALLRLEAGRNPQDRELSNLIGELATRSETFRTRWAAHNVHLHTTGSKTFHHPLVGDITLTFEGMQFAADPHLTLFAYTAEPGSPSSDALALLASWTAREAAAGSGPDAQGDSDEVGRSQHRTDPSRP